MESKRKFDLSWNLNEVTDKNAGRNLIKDLCMFIPTYSSGARQIYSDGECHFISEDRVVFFANKSDYTKTFSRIPSEAIRKTKIHLFSHEKRGLIFLEKSRDSKVKLYSFSQMLGLILRNVDQQKGFIPILQRSNICDTSDRRPLIELSSLNMVKLSEEFSSFEISMMMGVLKNGFINLEGKYQVSKPLHSIV